MRVPKRLVPLLRHCGSGAPRHAKRPPRAIFASVAWMSALTVLLGSCTDPGASEESAQPRPSATVVANPVDDVSFQFVVVGDYGTGGEEEYAVADATRQWVSRHGADAFVTTGDNVYPEGEREAFDEAWERPYGWVETDKLPVIATLGNHDVEEDGGEAVMNLLGMPGPWFEKELGVADIFVLDANRPDDPTQLRWLENALAGSEAAWQIVAFHQPAYSCANHDGTPEVVANWVPLFERYGVDLVLNGHDHNYQRFESEHGVTYVVTGGGGADLYELDACPEDSPERVVGDDDSHHFVVVQGSARELHLQAVAPDGSALDAFSISHQQ